MFNGKEWKLGQPVRFWTGVREGEGQTGKLCEEGVWMIGGSPAVYIRRDDGKRIGCVGLTHVDQIPSDSDGARKAVA